MGLRERRDSETPRQLLGRRSTVKYCHEKNKAKCMFLIPGWSIYLPALALASHPCISLGNCNNNDLFRQS